MALFSSSSGAFDIQKKVNGPPSIKHRDNHLKGPIVKSADSQIFNGYVIVYNNLRYYSHLGADLGRLLCGKFSDKC